MGHEETLNMVGAEIRPDLVDRMIELYCDWRTESAAVQSAYERFRDASASDRAAAFAAYTAALDREESACESYADQVHLIEARCAAARVRTGGRETSRPDPGR
jgi:hypothetical protein